MPTAAPPALPEAACPPAMLDGPIATATQPMVVKPASTRSPTVKAAAMCAALPMVLRAVPVEAACLRHVTQATQVAMATMPTAVKLIFSTTHPTAAHVATPVPTTMVRWSAPAAHVHQAALRVMTTATAT